jgi:adenine-specific DNA-methyltransferase
MLNSESKNWYNNVNIEHRKKYGQYFTPDNIKEILIGRLPITENSLILEPSIGTGEFIPFIKKHFVNPTINSYELDPDLAKLNDNCICADFLEVEDNNQYDFIVGNPPFFQFKPSKKIADKYSDIIDGRINIYSLFIGKSIDLLKEGGYLAFVLPTSMNSGSYFKSLREFIIKTCEIEEIIMFNSNEFDSAEQNVQILILKKTFNTGKNIFKIRDLTFFTKDYNRLYELTNGKKTLKECGYLAKTGTVVWNQHKLNLTTDNTKVKLIYSNNIRDGKLIDYNHPEKKQYIDTIKESDIYPSIVVNRIVGKVGSINIKSAIVNEPFLGENHVNIIYPITENVISIERVYESLNSSETKEIFEKLIGNTQISKTELEYLVLFD